MVRIHPSPPFNFKFYDFMHWSFAIVNGRLAEIHFEQGKKPKIFGHCYVQANEYKTKKEKNWIAKDTERFRLVYRKGKYRKILSS